jgi:hypothetical protein
VSSFLGLVILHLIFALGHGTSTWLAWFAVELSKVFHSFRSQSCTQLIKQIWTYAQADAPPFKEPRKVCYQFRGGQFHCIGNASGLLDHSHCWRNSSGTARQLW